MPFSCDRTSGVSVDAAASVLPAVSSMTCGRQATNKCLVICDRARAHSPPSAHTSSRLWSEQTLSISTHLRVDVVVRPEHRQPRPLCVALHLCHPPAHPRSTPTALRACGREPYASLIRGRQVRNQTAQSHLVPDPLVPLLVRVLPVQLRRLDGQRLVQACGTQGRSATGNGSSCGSSCFCS